MQLSKNRGDYMIPIYTAAIKTTVKLTKMDIISATASRDQIPIIICQSMPILMP